MTPKTVIDSYRDRTGDNDKNSQIIGDQEAVRYINDGMRLFIQEHPECQITAAGALLTFVEANKDRMSTDLVLSDTYFEPLVEYVCYRRYVKDAGDARDENRAATHLKNMGAFWTGVS